ncbi:MAG: RidA family protein [Candidatus Omnitrophica bacterium]|nr:RidA family protein [Candidatus Omnitrophota bacterium]
MNKKIIFTENAPKPVGPYNQAVEANGFVYLAGQIPLDGSGKLVSENVSEQTEQVFKNIQAVLTEAGCTLKSVVKASVFMKDLNDFAAMNEVYAKYFPADTAPARSTFQVAKLPLDVRVEIEIIACK